MAAVVAAAVADVVATVVVAAAVVAAAVSLPLLQLLANVSAYVAATLRYYCLVRTCCCVLLVLHCPYILICLCRQCLIMHSLHTKWVSKMKKIFAAAARPWQNVT